jgi:hypothetical protein
MKKILVVLAVFVLAVVLAGTMSCKPKPTVTAPVSTPFVLFDDFAEGDNRTDTVAFGGYWYSYDDLTNQIAVGSKCGDSNVWPISGNAAEKQLARTTETMVPTFVMMQYAILPSETPPVAGIASTEARPAGVTSDYYLRVSGTVDQTTAGNGYPYGFAGFGANLLDVDAVTGNKIPVDCTAAGYKRLQFWYKNGPSVTTSTPWSVALGTTYNLVSGCAMTDNDDTPFVAFTSTNVWQKFDHAFSEFAPHSWGTEIATTCEARGTASTCSTFDSVAYVGGAQFKCTGAEAMGAVTALKWQTGWDNTNATHIFDLEIAQVAITK